MDFYKKDFFLKPEIKSYVNEVTDLYDKQILNLDFNHTCLAVISLDSALKKHGTYYLYVLLKECRHIEKSN